MPSEITQVEKRAVRDSAERAGATEVFLVEQAMMAAIGAGLPITEPSGNMIVDIGGGTTDVAVISLAGTVYSRSVRIAGNEMDEAVIQYLKRKYNLLIGERTAEQIKIEIGSAYPLKEEIRMEIKGRDLVEGVPKTLTVTDEEIREALAEPVATIVDAVRMALERTPPELSADIMDKGIVLSGGGSLLRDLDQRLRERDRPAGGAGRGPVGLGGPRHRQGASKTSTCCARSPSVRRIDEPGSEIALNSGAAPGSWCAVLAAAGGAVPPDAGGVSAAAATTTSGAAFLRGARAARRHGRAPRCRGFEAIGANGGCAAAWRRRTQRCAKASRSCDFV